MTPVWFVVAAGGGAAARYGVSLVLARRVHGFPLGTLAVNVVGALLLGWVIGTDASTAVRTVVGTGLCGALTTFSTFANESVRLHPLKGAANVVLHLALGLGAAAAGLALA